MQTSEELIESLKDECEHYRQFIAAEQVYMLALQAKLELRIAELERRIAELERPPTPKGFL